MNARTSDGRRITLLVRGGEAPDRAWNCGDSAPQRLVFVGALTVLRYALAAGGEALTHDVGRVVIDHAATAAEFLDLLANLPAEFAGDALLISETHAFLSATGRGGDRVLYTLTTRDVDFYLEANGLTQSQSVPLTVACVA